MDISVLTTPWFDPQVNGYGGVDFQRDDVTEGELLRAVRAWRADGGGSFLLTLITDEWSRLVARLRRIRALRSSNAELGIAIAGWHIEGPFLSEKPGFCGAHNPAFMCDPKPEHLRELRDAAEDDLVLLTLAPERHQAIEATSRATGLGIRVSLGHTDASAPQLREAVSAGATGFTHLANGCPQQLDRHDNIVWRVLDTPKLVVGVIADRIHVAPALFRLIHKALPPERIYYTTDAMSAAGAPPGEYRLGPLQLRVGEDGIVRKPGASNFAGSALRPSQLKTRVVEMLGGDATEFLPATFRTAEQWLHPAGYGRIAANSAHPS